MRPFLKVFQCRFYPEAMEHTCINGIPQCTARCRRRLYVCLNVALYYIPEYITPEIKQQQMIECSTNGFFNIKEKGYKIHFKKPIFSKRYPLAVSLSLSIVFHHSPSVIINNKFLFVCKCGRVTRLPANVPS